MTRKDKNVELVRLLGWKTWHGAWKERRVVFGNGKNISLDFDTDLNAMREVWRVLKMRGLWDEFWYALQDSQGHSPTLMNANDIYKGLNDLPGQVEAAIKVLEEGK